LTASYNIAPPCHQLWVLRPLESRTPGQRDDGGSIRPAAIGYEPSRSRLLQELSSCLRRAGLILHLEVTRNSARCVINSVRLRHSQTARRLPALIWPKQDIESSIQYLKLTRRRGIQEESKTGLDLCFLCVACPIGSLEWWNERKCPTRNDSPCHSVHIMAELRRQH